MYVKRNSNKAKKSAEFKKKKKLASNAKIGIDKDGKEYIYNGDIPKPLAPVQSFKLDDKKKELKQKLIDLFPDVFNESVPKPLAKKIHLEIKEKLNELGIAFSSRNFFNVIKHWCGGLQYKKALVTNTHRFDLQGNQAEPLEEKEKADALQAMKYFIQQYNWRMAYEEEKKRKRARWLEKQSKKP
jgi:sRNA-binding protein